MLSCGRNAPPISSLRSRTRGCGSGGNVVSLSKAGYTAVGVDFAENTVKWLNQNLPELDIKVGDVRNLSYEDDSFAGYWSLGVIEHFHQDDYKKIISEMSRVISCGGYLFVSFPYMSPLRRMKTILGQHKTWQKREKQYVFYEYFLNADMTIDDLEKEGFVLVKKYSLNPIKGTKDEVGFLRPGLQVLHDYNGGNVCVKCIKYALSKILSPFAGHSILLVMRRK